MFEIQRPGINQKWAKQWKTTHKDLSGWITTFREFDRAGMEYYLLHGWTERAKKYAHLSANVIPPIENWEGLGSEFSMHAALCFAQFEIGGMENSINLSFAQHAFVAAYTAEMDALLSHLLALKRHGNVLRTLNYENLAYTALGVVIGCKEQAFRLARMQLLAYRKGYYLDNRHYPIYQFILRILADYLDEPPHDLAGEALKEPIFNALFSVWRTPDAGALTHVCLAACDYHTYRCKEGNTENFYEFEHGHWTRTPIEILLLFKLRQYLALKNPELDHPLMNSQLGNLHPEVLFKPDELTSRVLDRMHEDGYDDEKIHSDFMKS